MKYPTLREEELKNKVAHDFFGYRSEIDFEYSILGDE